jgi:hypothetical protein
MTSRGLSAELDTRKTEADRPEVTSIRQGKPNDVFLPFWMAWVMYLASKCWICTLEIQRGCGGGGRIGQEGVLWLL